MIPYHQARPYIESGDVIMVKARGLFSWLIRGLTGESFNHVAMFLANPSGVFVVEMHERAGWRMTPASQWVTDKSKHVLLWGKAPAEVRGSACIEVAALSRRAKKYSYLTLVKVWLSQIFRINLSHGLVCSTFVQACWQDCGYVMFNRLADPGDFMEHCTDINVLGAANPPNSPAG